MADDLSAARWATLTTKYQAFLSRNHEAAIRAGLLATHLRAAIVTACGCDESSVLFYKYEFGDAPIYDRYEKVENGHYSTIPTEHGWSFGLGVVLEPAPGGGPRAAVVMPFMVDVADSQRLVIRSHAFKDRIDVSPDTYDQSLREIAELAYQSLVLAVDSAATSGALPGRLGFAPT